MSQRELLHRLRGYLNFLRESDFIALDADIKKTPTREIASTLTTEEKEKALDALAKTIASCKKCRLVAGRTNTVPGSGNPNAALVFVGEAPGYYEDKQGLPFVGRAGKLLDRLLSGIGLSRKDVFICNVVKCRPPGNRDPLSDEIAACEPYLLKQIEILEPSVICALGRYAAQTLLRTKEGIHRLRGRFYLYHGIPLLPTLHTAAVLRNPRQMDEIKGDFDLISRKLQETASR